MKKKTQKGKLVIPYGILPEKHELETANIFMAVGKDVEFIAPSRTTRSKTPDVKIDGILWEMKSPMGKSKNTIFNAIRRAVKQSKYIIIDLRLTKITDDKAIKDLEISIAKVSSIKKVIIITKTKSIIELK